MKDFRTRTESRRPFYHSWIFLTVLVMVLGLFVRSAYASFAKKKTADIQQEYYQEKVDDLEGKKNNLEEKIQNLKTERGREEEYRKRFNVVKEGEYMIRIVE